MELARVNKITTSFIGGGVMQASFYKTHSKLGSVKSDDEKVAELGYQPLVAGEGEEITSSQRLAHFKEFIQSNAVQFGYTYDPVDRRTDGNKFPSKYDKVTFAETAIRVVTDKLAEIVEKLGKPVASLIKAKALAEGTVAGAEVVTTVDDIEVNITEEYKNGSIKYADANVEAIITLGGEGIKINVPMALVSGQLKKPKLINDDKAFTMTSIKNLLIENGIMPVVEKKATEEENSTVDETSTESAEA